MENKWLSLYMFPHELFQDEGKYAKQLKALAGKGIHNPEQLIQVLRMAASRTTGDSRQNNNVDKLANVLDARNWQVPEVITIEEEACYCAAKAKDMTMQFFLKYSVTHNIKFDFFTGIECGNGSCEGGRQTFDYMYALEGKTHITFNEEFVRRQRRNRRRPRGRSVAAGVLLLFGFSELQARRIIGLHNSRKLRTGVVDCIREIQTGCGDGYAWGHEPEDIAEIINGCMEQLEDVAVSRRRLATMFELKDLMENRKKC